MKTYFICLILFATKVNLLGQIAYTGNLGSNSSSVINCKTNTNIALLNTGIQSYGVAVNKINQKVYISNYGSSSVAVINNCNNIIETTITGLGAGNPTGLAVSPNGQRLYVPMYNSNIVHVINTATNSIINSITVGAGGISSPEQCVVSPDNTKIYVTLFDEDRIAVIDAATNTVITYFPSDTRPVGLDISNDGTKLFVTTHILNTLIVYNTATGSRLATITLDAPSNIFGDGGAKGVVLNHANSKAYVAMYEFNTVKVVDIVANTVLQTIPCGARPFGLDILPNDSMIYVSCRNANQLDVINTITGINFLSIPVGLNPYTLGKFIIKKNIDSVKIIKTLTACNAFNFQGQAFVNGVPISGWQWYFGDGGTDNVQNTSHTYLTANTYTVKLVVTDANGCRDSVTTNVTSGAAASANAGNDSTVCAGIPFNLLMYGTSLVTYSWSPAGLVSNPSIANPVATISGTQKFYCTVTNSSGCSVTDSVTYTVVPMTVNTTGNTNLCNGSTLQLNTTGAVSYSWSPIAGLSNPLIGDPIASPTITTKYYVTGTSAQGCTALDSITINVIPAPTVVTTIDSAICTGTSIQLNTTGAASYSWSPVAGLNDPSIPNPIATPLVNTQYIVTGTAANGCTAKDTVNISLKPLPVIIATNDSTICSGLSVQLNASGGVTYSWSPATGLSNAAIPNPIATPLVNTQYIVMGTAPNGCIGTDTVNINLSPPPVIVATNDNNLCTGSSIQLNATGASTYSWSPVLGLSNPLIANPIASPTITTKYYVTGTSAIGCTGIDSVTISLIPTPTVVTTPDSFICTGTGLQLNTLGAVSYSWSPAAGLNNTAIANPIATPLVNTQYIVTGTAVNGCTAKDTVNIGLKPLPVVIKSNDTTICIAGSAQLNVSGGINYSWTPVTGLNNPSIPNPIASPTISTLYKVTVTGANACNKLDSIQITMSAAPVYTISPPSSICNNSSLQLSAGGGDLYSWLPVTGLNNPFIANPQASPNITTPYTVRIISTACHDTAFRNTIITVNPLPNITALKSNDINCSFSTAQLFATGAVNYVWSPSTGLNDATIANPVANITSTTTYNVTGTDFNGCFATATVTVQAGFVAGGNLYIPNAFTPNGDGKNDCFGVRVYGTVNSFELTVFNRYGEKIFYTTDPLKCWNGIYKTKKQQIGNYVYIVNAKTSCGDFFKKGNILLLQ